MPPTRLSRRFFRRDPVTLAQALLGQGLVRILDDGTRLSGRIVEVEAYLGIADRAAHTFGGRHTPRNHSMYLDGGTAYVYFTYGMHWCLNIVAGRVGDPAACLIRALQPEHGIARMQLHRGYTHCRAEQLTNGPAKLTQAMALDRNFDGVDVLKSDLLFIERCRRPAPFRIAAAKRIGVDYAGAWARRRLRFFIPGNPFVSIHPSRPFIMK